VLRKLSLDRMTATARHAPAGYAQASMQLPGAAIDA
jgi:hypothetical protein